MSCAVLDRVTRWTTISGLVVGGLFAAPPSALRAQRRSTRTLLGIVGLRVTSLSPCDRSMVVL